MRKLGKRFDNVKETIQANSPCGNGCLCGGCQTCYCWVWFLDGIGTSQKVPGSQQVHNNFDKDNNIGRPY